MKFAELLRFERTLSAMWRAILAAGITGALLAHCELPTHGCINVSPAFYEQVVSPTFARGGVFYVLLGGGFCGGDAREQLRRWRGRSRDNRFWIIVQAVVARR